MGKETAISWAESTFNIAWGCEKVSVGCKNCYAEELSDRMYRPSEDVWGKNKHRRTFGEAYWNKLRKWNNQAEKEGLRSKIFCCSMCDVFEDHPTLDQERKKLWSAISQYKNLDFLLLTKRPENISRMLPQPWLRSFEDRQVLTPDNIWLGTSVEDDRVSHRIEVLCRTVAIVNFISYEPALGPLDHVNLCDVNWVIYGGESGPSFRADKTQWARDMRKKCDDENRPFFYKQGSHRYTEVKVTLDGETVQELPLNRRGEWHPKILDKPVPNR